MSDKAIFKAKCKKVGNSVSVVIPYRQRDKLGIKPGDEIVVAIKRAKEKSE